MFKLIYKKFNESSFSAIKKFQKQNNIFKIGHTGTLDVLAQGLLLIATDDDTKLISFISNKDKEYKVICKLGYISKTYDYEGPISNFSNHIPSYDEIEKCLMSFLGTIEQIPPIYSAKKINGERSYNLARKNKQEINLKKIIVEIYEIKDIKYHYPFVEFTTLVSNGTYIRTLVHDFGMKLKTGSYITFLERTMISGFRKEEEIDIKKLILLDRIFLNKEQIKKLFNGIKLNFNLNNNWYLLEYENIVVGIVLIENSIIIKINLFGKKIVNILKDDK